MPSNRLLASRHSYPGDPARSLNDVQQDQIASIQQKLDEGIYTLETPDCPLCNHTPGYRRLAERDRYGLKHNVVCCLGCGLIQTRPRMDADSYAEFYDTEYRPLYSGSHGSHKVIFEKQRQKGMEIYDYLDDRISGFHGMNVLEIGTGPGGILSVFDERGHQTRGIDLGSESVAFAQSNGLDVEVASAADVTIDASPDIVVLSHVVEHFLTPVADLEAVRDLCAPETQVYVEVPGVKSLWWTYQSDFLQMVQNAHTYYFTANTLTALLAAAGFETVGCNEYIRGLWTPATQSDQSVESDFDDVTTFLNRMEYLRHLPTPARLRQYNIPNPRDVVKRFITGEQNT